MQFSKFHKSTVKVIIVEWAKISFNLKKYWNFDYLNDLNSAGVIYPYFISVTDLLVFPLSWANCR